MFMVDLKGLLDLFSRFIHKYDWDVIMFKFQFLQNFKEINRTLT